MSYNLPNRSRISKNVRFTNRRRLSFSRWHRNSPRSWPHWGGQEPEADRGRLAPAGLAPSVDPPETEAQRGESPGTPATETEQLGVAIGPQNDGAVTGKVRGHRL